MARLEQRGCRAQGTTRRRETAAADRLYLDLASDLEPWVCSALFEAAVVCAGVSKNEAIARDPEEAARVNLRGIPSLIRTLIARRTFVVFLSTNAVFDGSRPHATPEEAPAPITEYGRHKAIVEQQVLAHGQWGAVVRMTKVLGPGSPFIQEWAELLRKGETIHPFADACMAPTSLSFVVRVLERILEERAPGVSQVSGPTDITFAQAAFYLAHRLGARPALVQPVLGRETRPDLKIPRYTTLETSRLVREFGLVPPTVWSAMDEAIGWQDSKNLTAVSG